MLLRFLSPAALALLLLAACGDRSQSAADGREPIPRGIDPAMVEWRSDGVLIPSPDSLRKTPGYVVDSVFSPEENLRRFQATVSGPPPTRLTGGAASTDALLRQYWSLLAAGDTLAMTPLIVSRGEYAYLYAPFAPEMEAGMPPHIGWELIMAQTGRGLVRALQHAKAKPGPVIATACSDNPRAVGSGRLYGPCGVVLRGSAGPDTVWVAKSLFSRDGVHKLIGLQNELRALP